MDSIHHHHSFTSHPDHPPPDTINPQIRDSIRNDDAMQEMEGLINDVDEADEEDDVDEGDEEDEESGGGGGGGHWESKFIRRQENSESTSSHINSDHQQQHHQHQHHYHHHQQQHQHQLPPPPQQPQQQSQQPPIPSSTHQPQPSQPSQPSHPSQPISNPTNQSNPPPHHTHHSPHPIHTTHPISLDDLLVQFWTKQMDVVENEEIDFKHGGGGGGGGNANGTGTGGGGGGGGGGGPSGGLPLARIKKVMKSDPEVKMISAEAPILLAKACEIFITELTTRAWQVAESHKRRTLQKSDVASAIGFSDMFDFLIDIVPREEAISKSELGLKRRHEKNARKREEKRRKVEDEMRDGLGA